MDRAPWILSAVLALVVGGLILSNLDLRNQVDALKGEVIAAQKEGVVKGKRQASRSKVRDRREESSAEELQDALGKLELADPEQEAFVEETVARYRTRLTGILRDRKDGLLDFGAAQEAVGSLREELRAELAAELGAEEADGVLASLPRPLGEAARARSTLRSGGGGSRVRAALEARAAGGEVEEVEQAEELDEVEEVEEVDEGEEGDEGDAQ